MSTEPQPPPDSPAPAKKPWSLGWIALAIVIYIVGYTAVNVIFRKPTPPHEPAAEMEQRRQTRTVQATMAGWTRLDATLMPGPAAPPIAISAQVERLPPPARLDRHVPVELALIAPGQPSLHPGPARLNAPARLDPGPLMIDLAFTPADDLPALGDVWVYAKDHNLHLFLQDHRRPLPDTPPLAAGPAMHLLVPAPALPAGIWQATLYSGEAMFRWTFVVE